MYVVTITWADPEREQETKEFPNEQTMRTWLIGQGDTMTMESPGEDAPQIWRFGVSRGGFPVLTADAAKAG